jgi:urea transport system permease protein
MRSFYIYSIALLFCLLITPLIAEEFTAVVSIALLFGLLAASVDFSVGYVGVLNLGPCLYFGVGAYSSAYGLTNGWPFIVCLGFAICTTGAIAITVGLLFLRTRQLAFTHAIVGLCLSLAAQQLSVGAYHSLGGSNGVTGFSLPVISIGSLHVLSANSYSYLRVVLCICCILLGLFHFVVQSRLGALMNLIRDQPRRAASFGYDVCSFRMWGATVSAIVSSIAGVFYAPVVGIAHPSMFGVAPNMLVFVWIAVGGISNLNGPFLCAVLLKVTEYKLGSTFESYYLLVMAGVFILSVILFPKGIARAFSSLLQVKGCERFG